MHDAQLHLDTGKDTLDGLEKTLDSVDTGDQDIRHFTIPQLRQVGQPKVAPFILPDPHTQKIFVTDAVDAETGISRPGENPAVLPHFVMDGVQVDDEVDLAKGRACHSSTKARIFSVTLEMKVGENSTP